MAILDSSRVQYLRNRLESCTSQFIIAGFDIKSGIAKSLEGPLGILDWNLHGQASSLIKDPQSAKSILILGQGKLGKANLILINTGSDPNLSSMEKTLSGLHPKSISVVNSTFSDKQNERISSALHKLNLPHENLEEK